MDNEQDEQVVYEIRRIPSIHPWDLKKLDYKKQNQRKLNLSIDTSNILFHKNKPRFTMYNGHISPRRGKCFYFSNQELYIVILNYIFS